MVTRTLIKRIPGGITASPDVASAEQAFFVTPLNLEIRARRSGNAARKPASPRRRDFAPRRAAPKIPFVELPSMCRRWFVHVLRKSLHAKFPRFK